MEDSSKRKSEDCEKSCSSEGSTDSEEDSIDSDDEEIKNKEIQIDFEAAPILEQDRNGIKRLLKQLFLKEPIDLNQLTDTIINQENIGAIIRQISDEAPEEDEDEDGDEEVFGFISFLDLSSADTKSKAWHSAIMNYFTSNLEGEKKSEIEKILNNDRVKKLWIINLRFVNINWKIAVPSFEIICREVNIYNVKPEYYIMICRILYPKVRRTKEKKKAKQDREDVLFLNPEEELFDEFADFKFEFDVSSQCDSGTMGGDWEEGDQEYCPCRRVLLFSASSWTKANENLKKHASAK